MSGNAFGTTPPSRATAPGPAPRSALLRTHGRLQGDLSRASAQVHIAPDAPAAAPVVAPLSPIGTDGRHFGHADSRGSGAAAGVCRNEASDSHRLTIKNGGHVERRQIQEVPVARVTRSHAESGPEAQAQFEDGAAPARTNELVKFHRLMRGRYLLAATLAIVGAAAGAFVGFRCGTKTFQSMGQVRVRSDLEGVINPSGPGRDFGKEFVAAQASLLRSQSVTDAALMDRAWQSLGRGNSDEVALKFRASLSVSEQGEMIWVSATDPDPVAATAIVGSAIRAYEKRYVLFDKKDQETLAAELRKLETTYSNQLAEKRRNIEEISNRYASENLSPLYDDKFRELRRYEGAMQEIHLAMAGFKPDQSAAATQPAEMSAVEIAEAGDREMATYLAQREGWEQDVRRLETQKALPDHPQLVTARRMLALVDGDIERHRAAVVEKRKGLARLPSGPSKEIRGMSVDELKAQLAALDELRAKLDAEVKEIGRTMLELQRLRGEHDAIKAKLDGTLRRQEEQRIEADFALANRVVVLSHGERPLGPYKDTRPVFAAAGALGGGSLFFGLIAALALLDRRVRNVHDAGNGVNATPMLGVLPALPDGLEDPEQAALAAHCVHEIRAHLQIRGGPSGHQAIAITSPVAGTGKTSLTLALGVSFATSNHRTLLIDFDFVGGGLSARVDALIRRKIGNILEAQGLITAAELGDALRVAQETDRKLGQVLVEMGYLSPSELNSAIASQDEEVLGLLDVLSGERLANCVAETGIPGLHVLTVGHASAHHVGRLSPAGVQRVLRAAREEFDMVLVDTGPTPGSLEASMVASQVDGVILAVSRGEQRPLVERCASHLVSVGAQVAGIVFNRATARDMSDRMAGSSSVMTSARTRVAAELRESVESANFGPIARAVASYAPVANGPDRSRA